MKIYLPKTAMKPRSSSVEDSKWSNAIERTRAYYFRPTQQRHSICRAGAGGIACGTTLDVVGIQIPDEAIELWFP